MPNELDKVDGVADGVCDSTARSTCSFIALVK
jgi:hypothetical protein